MPIPTDQPKAIAVLKSIIWDYDVDPDELYGVMTGQRSKAGPFTFDRLFVRMLERLSWYELLDLLGMDYIKEHLTEEIIGKIRFKTLRGRELCITPLFVIPVKTGIQEVVNIAGYRRSCPLGYSPV